jgi:hypothetical protein
MTDYTHDDAMRDLEWFREWSSFPQLTEKSCCSVQVKADRLAAYIERLEAENDTLLGYRSWFDEYQAERPLYDALYEAASDPDIWSLEVYPQRDRAEASLRAALDALRAVREAEGE